MKIFCSNSLMCFVLFFSIKSAVASCTDSTVLSKLDQYFTNPTDTTFKDEFGKEVNTCNGDNIPLLTHIAQNILTPKILDPVTPNEQQQALRELHALVQQKLAIYSSNIAEDSWADRFQKHFYLGFEGSSVAGFDERTTVRTGLLIYNILVKNESRPDPPKNNKCIETKELHVFGNALLTSSAEITPTIGGTPEAEQGTNSTKTEVEPAFEGDVSLFYAFRECPSGMGRDQRFLAGPIIHYSINKPDSAPDYTKKYYFGLRFTHSPESFFDVILGKTEGLDGHRLEFKGQTALSELANGSVYIGAIANIGISNADENSDSLRLYATWHYDLNKWLTL